MTEEFLHYLWQYRLLDQNLRIDTGENLTVLHPGNHNHDGGPDFFNARIRIGETIWAGNVEIHVAASDWFRHKHHDDHAYDNVILHVVYENDFPVIDRNQKIIPTLSVKGCFAEDIYSRYEGFLQTRSWIPCETVIRDLSGDHFEYWSAGLAVERLGYKSMIIRSSWESSGYDWEETFKQNLFRAFGFKVNAQPFELLSKSIPLKLLNKHRGNLFQLEALLFGQSGMLEGEVADDYFLQLKAEYNFIRDKYSLTPIDQGLWKFLRLRPSNFPSIRIAQLAQLLHDKDSLFTALLKQHDPEQLSGLFSATASSFWDTHYTFRKLSGNKPKLIGTCSTQLLILNFVVPFLFFYGQEKDKNELREGCLTLLENLPGESNSDINRWKTLGFPVNSGLYTQALIQLKSVYCDRKRCLECRMGNKLLNSEVAK